jgi:cytochrome c biogenesis protein CcdA
LSLPTHNLTSGDYVEVVVPALRGEACESEWVNVLSQYVVGGIVITVWGALMAIFFHTARRGDWYVNKTVDSLIRFRLAKNDRERGIKQLRGMLLIGLGFALVFMAIGVDSLVVGLRG